MLIKRSCVDSHGLPNGKLYRFKIRRFQNIISCVVLTHDYFYIYYCTRLARSSLWASVHCEPFDTRLWSFEYIWWPEQYDIGLSRFPSSIFISPIDNDDDDFWLWLWLTFTTTVRYTFFYRTSVVCRSWPSVQQTYTRSIVIVYCFRFHGFRQWWDIIYFDSVIFLILVANLNDSSTLLFELWF